MTFSQLDPDQNAHSETIESGKQFAAAIWIRPPVGRDVCRFTGLRHAKFYAEFCRNPRIRQVRLGTGTARGTRLLWLPDIYAELHRRAHEQAVNDNSDRRIPGKEVGA